MKITVLTLTLLALGQIPYGLGAGPLCLMAQHQVLLAQQGQSPVEPPEYPEGHYCAYVTQRNPHPEHPCACHRECVPSEDENGNQTIVTKEDAQCKQWCHANRCACPAKNCD